MNMKLETIQALSERTADNTPAPGGGSASALAGAFAASLLCMVARLTIGKKGYEAAQSQMQDVLTQAEPLRLLLLDAIQQDADSFDAFMEALRLPKENEEQVAQRTKAMQDALKGACMVPLKNAQNALSVLELSITAVKLGNTNATSDGLVGALLARSAVLGCLNNVRINLGGIKDEAFVLDMRNTCDRMEARATALEDEARKASNLR